MNVNVGNEIHKKKENMLLQLIWRLINSESINSMADPVILDVGGLRYATTLLTLSRYPDSVLGRLAALRTAGRVVMGLPLQINEDGAVFIDRDGALFRHILNFLRTDSLTLPNDFMVKWFFRFLQYLQGF